MAANHGTLQGPSGKRPHPGTRLANKLSFRLSVVLPILAIGTGAGGAFGATQVGGEVFGEVIRSISEALMVTGATTALVTFAFSDRLKMGAAVKDAIQEDCEPRFDGLLQAVQGLASDTKLLANSYVLDRADIYRHSIALLRELKAGEVHILMSADEDLADANGDGESVNGEAWLAALKAWLDSAPDVRRLYRVIAVRPGSTQDATQTRARLLAPFVGVERADQWVYPDIEFSVSVLLLGPRKAIFGFLPRSAAARPGTPRVRPDQARIEYAVVVTSEKLVRHLSAWLDGRYMDHSTSAEVMRHGIIQEAELSAFEKQLGVNATSEL